MDLPDPDSEQKQRKPKAETPPEGNRLWKEYELIQSKIDKIGDFQFKVKSWSATLFGGVLLGGAATLRFPATLVTLFCAFALAVMFHLSERRQRQISKRLGRRASALERAFSELPPIADIEVWERIQRRIPSLHSVPGIASSIIGEREDKWEAEWLWEDWKAVGRWLVNHSDDVFYVAQYLLVVGLFILTVAMKTYHLWVK